MASQWAETLKERDGKARYALLSADAKAPYYEALTAQNGHGISLDHRRIQPVGG